MDTQMHATNARWLVVVATLLPALALGANDTNITLCSAPDPSMLCGHDDPSAYFCGGAALDTSILDENLSVYGPMIGSILVVFLIGSSGAGGFFKLEDVKYSSAKLDPKSGSGGGGEGETDGLLNGGGRGIASLCGCCCARFLIGPLKLVLLLVLSLGTAYAYVVQPTRSTTEIFSNPGSHPFYVGVSGIAIAATAIIFLLSILFQWCQAPCRVRSPSMEAPSIIVCLCVFTAWYDYEASMARPEVGISRGSAYGAMAVLTAYASLELVSLFIATSKRYEHGQGFDYVYGSIRTWRIFRGWVALAVAALHAGLCHPFVSRRLCR